MTATRTPASNDAEKVQARISSSHRAWEVTTFLIITGGMLAVGGWYCLAYSDTPKLALLPKQINAVVVTSVIYTNLAAMGIFGLIGLYSRDSTALGLYAVLLWNHFVLSLLSGGFLLWAMLYGDPASGNGLLNQCSVLASSNMVTQVLCEYNFQRLQNIATGTTVAMWIIQFGACITCSHFVSLAARDDDVIYEGPEFGTVWAPQASQGGYDVVEVLEEADDEEYKTPRTAEFSRFSWV